MPVVDTSLGAIAFDASLLAAGPTVMLLHGAGVDRTMWAPQWEALRASHSIVTVDLPGHGESSPIPHRVSMVQIATAVGTVFEQVTSDREVVVCGHSFGGMVAQILAVQQQQRVAGLVLAETSMGIRTTRWESLATTLTNPLLLSRWMSMRLLATMSARSYGATEASREYVRTTMQTMHLESFQHVWRALSDYDGRAWLTKITCPTLVVVAEQNRRTHPQARRMAELIAGARQVQIADASHILNLDQPEAFTELLRTRT